MTLQEWERQPLAKNQPGHHTQRLACAQNHIKCLQTSWAYSGNGQCYEHMWCPHRSVTRWLTMVAVVYTLHEVDLQCLWIFVGASNNTQHAINQLFFYRYVSLLVLHVLFPQHEELRVASLEQKLTELSKTVGNYDQQREADQTAIQWVCCWVK